MSEAKRYQSHVFELLRPHVGAHVLEVGCGIGTTSLRLAEIAERLVCIEPNLNCVSRAHAALDGHPKISLKICHLEECDPAEMVRERFDSIVCVNVLEHIEDDVRALRLFRDLVAPAGLKVVILRYTNAIGLLGWMYNAHITGTTEHTSGQVRLFEQLVAPWALPLDRLVAPPLGLSLFAVGR